MVGHFRRALFENLLRESAELSGLSVVDNQHAGDNVGYVLVTAPRTEFTIHSVDNPNRFVRECVSRKQHAAVNRLVDGYLDGTLRQNPPRLDGEKPVYHLILHGTEERTDESGKLYRSTFLRVAIPDAELKRYRRNYNVPEILQWYASTEVNASKVKSLDLARPTPEKEEKGHCGMIGTPGFIGDRLTQAREARGLNGVDLAELVGVSSASLGNYERGKQTPRSDVLDAISKALNVQRELFLCPMPTLSKEGIWPRSLSSATKAMRTKAEARFMWMKELVAYLGEYLDFPRLTIPAI